MFSQRSSSENSERSYSEKDLLNVLLEMRVMNLLSPISEAT
jgi:hypothetical protein